MLSHCPLESRESPFEEIKVAYNDDGKKYKIFLNYYQKKIGLEMTSLEACLKLMNKIATSISLGQIILVKYSTNISVSFDALYSLIILGQVFQFAKPRPGYFIEKIKEIELKFRGEYLSQCEGKKKKSKSNLDKNPLEGMSLPYEELIQTCATIASEAAYSFKELKKNKKFIDCIRI